MYEEFTQGGHSYNHHGSVSYYSPNELTRICRHHPDEYAIEEYAHGKQTERDIPKHHRPHHKPKNINEFDYESTTRKRKEKRKHKKEHPEEVLATEQYRSVPHQHRENRKHRKSTKQAIDGFAGLNHQDIQRLMTDCNKDINEPSNFSIGYYEIRKNLRGQSVDQIPTRDVPSADKIFKISDDYHQKGDSSEMNKCKEAIYQQFEGTPKDVPLADEGFYTYHPQVNEEGQRHKIRRHKEKSKREKEFKASDSVSVDRIVRRNIFNKHNYPKWNSEDSAIQNCGQHTENIAHHLEQTVPNIENHNQQLYSQNVENFNCKEGRGRNIFRSQVDCEIDRRNEKSKIIKLDNGDKNYKSTKKYMKKIAKNRDTADFRPRTRKIEYEMNKDGYHTPEYYSDQKKNEELVKKRSSKKDQHKLIDFDHEARAARKSQDNKIEYRKQKTKKEHTRIKSVNESQSLDRANKSKLIDRDISTNNNLHKNLDQNFTLLNTKYTSDTSLSTLHRKNDDFNYLFNIHSPAGETTRFDANTSKKKYCDLPPFYILESDKSVGVNSEHREDFPRYRVDQIIYPVLSDDVSMQDRVELFQTAMKKDLSVRPRSNYSLCGYISSKIEINSDITKNAKDITFKNNFNTGDYHFDAATSTTPKNIHDENKKDKNRIESDETENMYGIIVKGVEPSKNMNTFRTNQVNLSAEKRTNTLECKILSVVAITPDNSEDKIDDLDVRLMRTMSSGLLKKDIALQVRNPSSDKRLERLLKYYRVEPHPERNNFSSCSERSSKDRRILKKLIIGKLADYLKKLQEDNTGEIIEFRTENPRVVKLVLPIDCLSLECSYDINFSNEELVSDTAKESLSDLYINYSDVDDVSLDQQQIHIHPNIQTDNIEGEKDAIIFEDNTVNGTDLKNCPAFSEPPASLRNPKQFQTEIVINRRKFDSQPSQNEDLNVMQVNTTERCQPNANKEFIGMECLNLKNSSTFIVSENDRSSANVNCLSNFQNSPRDSLYMKTLQISDNYTQHKIMENNSTSSKDCCQNALFGLKKEDIPNTKIETSITVRTATEPRNFSEFFQSRITPVERDFFNREENIPQVLQRTLESNNCCQVKQEPHEYSKRATEFLVKQSSNNLGKSDQILKKADYINWINQAAPDKSDFMKTIHEISSNTIDSPHFKQGFENSSMKNENCKKEKTFLQKDSNQILGKIINEMDITFNKISEVNPQKGQNNVVDENRHCTNALLPTKPTIVLTDQPEVLLLGQAFYKQVTELKNLMNIQSEDKKINENVACPEAKIRKSTSKNEVRHNINDKQVNTDNQTSGEKELNKCLQKCLNWDIRDASKTKVAEVADVEQNKTSGLNKGTQKSGSKRSCIPVAKRDISKCSSVQMRSSSLGRDNNTSLLLTKSYRIPLGQSSYEKRKQYDTSIRKNVKRRSLSESSGTTNKNPLIYEVRYFNIHNNCLPSSINQSYERTENDVAIESGFSIRFNKVEQKTSHGSSGTASPKNSECNLKFLGNVDDFKLHQSKHSILGKNYSQNNQSGVDFSKEYSMPPGDIPITYIQDPAKMKISAQKKNSHDNLDSSREKINSRRSRISVKCSEKVHARKKRLRLKKRNRGTSDQNTEYDKLTSNFLESRNCQKLTKLSIEKGDNDELVLYFGKQNLTSTETEFSKSFDGKSLVNSSSEGIVLENSDSIDDNGFSSESTLVNRQESLSSTSIATIRGFEAGEVIEHSVIDSGYLTKEAEINYSRTTLEGGEKKGKNELCELLKCKTSRWSQRDLFRLKLQLLFPNVYDDFELIEAAENTELIEFYLDSGNDKLIKAVETISSKKEMNVKSRSVISLPSTKTILKENGPFKSIGDVPSDAFFKMNKGGFYNYQKFIAQNNDQYSSDILSKIKCRQDYNNGRETTEDDYPRSETSSMKSSSLNSVKSISSARKSIIELFKLRSCKNIASSSEVIVTEGDATEKDHNENISEEQFTNHFHQIMAMECQKFAKKVKNESLLRENTKQIEEFKEMPLDLILKNRNNSLKSRIDIESLPSLIETVDSHIDGINELSMPIPDNFCESPKPVDDVKITESAANSSNKPQTTLGNKSITKNNSKLQSISPTEESIPESFFSENSNLSIALDKLSNISARTPISEVLSCGKIKQPEKEFFNNLLNFYDHETEFATKLIRDNEFFVSLLEKIREDDSLNLIYQKDIQKKIKKGKKVGILTRLFRRKKKSNESLLTAPSMSKSLEFAKSLSAENNSVHRESCYSFFKDIEDFEIGSESERKNQAATEILKKLAFKAKSHLEPMAKATLSNQRINDRIKLAGFLNFLDMIQKGNIACMSNVNNNKSVVEEKVREHVAQLFDKVYRIANREVVQRNTILDDKKIDLLKFLVTKYHMGMDVHINILAIYIGRSLIQSRTQLEDAILSLMRLNTEDVNLEEFEKNCGIHRGQ